MHGVVKRHDGREGVKNMRSHTSAIHGPARNLKWDSRWKKFRGTLLKRQLEQIREAKIKESWCHGKEQYEHPE
jgi:hypothetical protein